MTVAPAGGKGNVSGIMTAPERFAPGWPGMAPRWTSSAKSGVGTSVADDSRLWFTLSHGVVNEVYYPRIDQACTRDMGCIVTDGAGYVSEEKRHTATQISRLAPGAPAYHLVNTSIDGRYRIEKDVIADPERPALLQRMRFVAQSGTTADYRVHLLLAPHLTNHGSDNTAWIEDYRGAPMLFASRGDAALAVACSAPWSQRSAGFVGVSDGWRELMEEGRLTETYTRAENGNVALIGTLEGSALEEEWLVVLAFGADRNEAGHRARAAVQRGFDTALKDYVLGWDTWQDGLRRLDDDRPDDLRNLYRVSTMVARTHESTGFPGGTIASLSIPWGFSKGDEDLGGYHLVWPRDLVETAGGLLAAGARSDTRRILAYLRATQDADGHWPQNMWIDGSEYWPGIQMDETALPILLVDLARRHGALGEDEVIHFWPMVRAAAGYLVRNGPVSPQDRWEEEAGYSPFTVGAEIAALLVAAEIAEREHEGALAGYFRDTADAWYGNIDRWMFATLGAHSTRLGLQGNYVRVAPVEDADGVTRLQQCILVHNVPAEESSTEACDLVSPDALALVRFGLRRADDPRITDTVAVIDALLKVDTPTGPCWRRYNGDGYGEHRDGSPFNGTGVGRAWPLLTGERAHYELLAGRADRARELLATMESFASDGGLLPEQIWDGPDIPERELFFGRPAGSAMPLVWAHAEYIKLRRSLRDGSVFDLPPQTVARYLDATPPSARAVWRFNHKIRRCPPSQPLRIELLAEATLHWSTDGWRTTHDTPSWPTGVGVHVVDVEPALLPVAGNIDFTFHWTGSARWEGTDFRIAIGADAASDATQ